MDITVTYQLTPDEGARAVGLNLRRRLIPARVVVPALLVLLGFFGVLLEAVSVGVGLGMFAAAAIFPVVLTWNLKRNLRRSVAHLCEPLTIRVTDDGYECAAATFTQSMRWAKFDRVERTKEFWLFYRENEFVAFLPLAAFDETQRAEVWDLLTRRMRRTAQ